VIENCPLASQGTGESLDSRTNSYESSDVDKVVVLLNVWPQKSDYAVSVDFLLGQTYEKEEKKKRTEKQLARTQFNWFALSVSSFSFSFL
jgi:hypothetical protein